MQLQDSLASFTSNLPHDTQKRRMLILMFIFQFPILTLNKRSLQGGLLNLLDIFRPARVPGDTNVPHFSLMEVIKVEKRKMKRSLSSVLTLMASLSSPNIVVDQFLMGGIQPLPIFIFGIQSHLLPQVDLDVLIYERVVLDVRETLFSIHFSLPYVLKTKRECPILFSKRLVFQSFDHYP